jgi:hypothetical protein
LTDELADDEGSGVISATTIVIASMIIMTIMLGYQTGVKQLQEVKLVGDVTALWAAEQWRLGVSPCQELIGEVEQIAVRNQLNIATCEILGDDVQIEISRPGSPFIKATSLAGPTSLGCEPDPYELVVPNAPEELVPPEDDDEF